MKGNQMPKQPQNSFLLCNMPGLSEFTGYCVTTGQEVLTCRDYGDRFATEWKIKSKNIGTTGYYKVDICAKGAKKTLKVHRLIAIAFILNPMNLPEVNHKDGNKLNNEISNLEWCTRKENIDHSILNQFRDTAFGDRIPHAKFSNSQIESIFDLKCEGKENKEIADIMNVREWVISGIVARRTYSLVPISEDKVVKAKEINRTAFKRNWNKRQSIQTFLR